MNGLSLLSAILSFTAIAGPGNKVALSVPSIMCSSCATKVEGIIKSSPGVSDLVVSDTDRTANFTCDKGAGCDVKKIMTSLNEAAYPATIVK